MILAVTLRIAIIVYMQPYLTSCRPLVLQTSRDQLLSHCAPDKTYTSLSASTHSKKISSNVITYGSVNRWDFVHKKEI